MEGATVCELRLLLEISELVVELICLTACSRPDSAHIDIVDLNSVECVPRVLVAAKHNLT